ncbi:MAG TPA: helix-turn-helix domain-containing protein [Micromonosporaceae bacterium]|nr:helix-turn-helix domain-containing protein [Micromonosporaceae bacterium]
MAKKQETTGVREQRDALGLSRAVLTELTGLTPAKIWRAEQGRASQEEAQVLAAALESVATNGLPEHLQARTRGAGEGAGRVSRAVLVNRLQVVRTLLAEAAAARTLREVRALLEQAEAAAAGTGESE